jgi:hypothetical protein
MAARDETFLKFPGTIPSPNIPSKNSVVFIDPIIVELRITPVEPNVNVSKPYSA